VAFHRLRSPKRDMMWVALAGPGINLLLAFAAALLLQPLGQMDAGTVTLWLWENLKNAITANVVLACFNMLPIPPLDGGRVVTGLLPDRYAWRFARLEPYGLLIIIGVAFLVPLVAREFGYAFSPLAWVLLPMIQLVQGLVLALTGW
jgi:Zn-dependent protease